VRIYTGRGDDGTTGLFGGGRVAKDESGPEAYGAVDEAVSALGAARAIAGELAASILEIQRDLFVVGAELAAAARQRSRLEPGTSLVTDAMVGAIERRIDAIVAEAGTPAEFVVPGGSPLAAALDLARTVLRRAERRAVAHLRREGIEDSAVVPYLNRVGDYVYVLARLAEGKWTPSRKED
jgi:cob(I)alamin adenosyltransferase